MVLFIRWETTHEIAAQKVEAVNTNGAGDMSEPFSTRCGVERYAALASLPQRQRQRLFASQAHD